MEVELDTRYSLSAPVGAASDSAGLNINEAARACGLSPSVLRIWELRYGWPNPKRKANGYRTYSSHLIEDLKRAARLIKDGMAIRQLIVDGLPSWPGEAKEAPKSRTLDRTRALPAPKGRYEGSLRSELIRSLETHRTGQAEELMQRVAWQVRREEELHTALAPVVAALIELVLIDRPISAPGLLAEVLGRCRQICGGASRNPDALVLRPVDDNALPLAWVAAVALGKRGISARVDTTAPNGGFTVGPGGNIQAFPEGDDASVIDLATLLEDGDPPLALT
jgi:DNA-binding transcriptional MerR regulator